MKKALSSVLLLCMLALLAVGCSTTPAAPTPPPASETLKVGINYELSGAVATYGSSSVEGFEMAIEKVNAAGGVNGKQIELVKYDNRSDPAEATTLANRLFAQDGVLAAVGPATSGAFKATIPVANSNKVPVISGSATADDVTGVFQFNADGSPVLDANGKPVGLNEYAFRICFNDSFQGTAMAKFAANNLNASRAALITDTSSDYGRGLARNFVDTFTVGGGTIVAEEGYVAGDTDFNAIITKLAGLDIDVIFIPGYYNEAGLIIKAARAQGIDAPILGADGFDSPELLNLAGADALNDVYFSNHYSSLSTAPVVTAFINEFQAKFGRAPDAFNALGYDLGMFVADALDRAAEETGEAVKDALESTTNFNGVTGSFSVDAMHNPVKALVVIGLVNGDQATSENVSLD